MKDLVRRKTPDRRTGGGEDARRASRYEVRIAVSFTVAGGATVDATCRNVGLGGMFVETTTVVPFEAVVVIAMPLPGIAGPVTIKSIVRWVAPDGFGVQFESMGARETHALTELIYGG